MSDEKTSFMGIDYGGFDGKTFAVCVSERINGVYNIRECEVLRDQSAFDKLVEGFVIKYKIPKHHIVKEIN